MANDAPLLLDVSRLVWRRWAGRHPTGIDRVCLAYLERFAPHAQAVVHHRRFRRILDRVASARLFRLLGEPAADFRAGLVKSILRHPARLNCRGNGRLYLNIGHTGLDSDGFRTWAREAGVRPVYLVHDLIPITHPELCRAGELQRHRSRIRTVLSTAEGIIGNSQATLESLRDFGRAEGLPQPPQVAAWLGSTPLPRSMANSPSERPAFVVLGTIEARKNHMLLLNIWSRLVARLGTDAPRLLIIGQRGWEAEQVYDVLERSETLRGHVEELGNCSDEELTVHLASARALLFPSMAEGFGLPLVEALGLGVPVIASDIPVFREVGQQIPTYLSPIDGVGWESAILDYASPNSTARSAQLERMTGFRLPDWSSHFRTVEEWLPTLGSAAKPLLN